MPAASLTRIELRLGLLFWAVLAASATLAGAASTFWPFAVPVVVASAALWHLRRRPFTAVVLDWVPLLFVIFTYETLAHVVPACWQGTIDDALRAADRALFGTDVGVLLEPWSSPFATRVFSLAYGSYYVLPLALAIWFWRRNRRAFRELVAGEVGALFIGYLGYLFLPAIGPYLFHPEVFAAPLPGDLVGDAIRELNAGRPLGPPRDVFPSLHTANAVTLLLVAWKFDRRALAVFAVPCLALIAATVYLRFHYVVDVAAGALLAVAWQAVVPHCVAHEGMRDAPADDLQSAANPGGADASASPRNEEPR